MVFSSSNLMSSDDSNPTLRSIRIHIRSAVVTTPVIGQL